MDQDRWKTFSIAFQLVSIEVDLSRALRQFELGYATTARRCLQTALDYTELTLAANANQLPQHVRRSLEHFVHEISSRKVDIDVSAIKKLQHAIKPYQLIVARERGLA